jgi:hypothetical protein
MNTQNQILITSVDKEEVNSIKENSVLMKRRHGDIAVDNDEAPVNTFNPDGKEMDIVETKQSDPIGLESSFTETTKLNEKEKDVADMRKEPETKKKKTLVPHTNEVEQNETKKKKTLVPHTNEVEQNALNRGRVRDLFYSFETTVYQATET